MLNIFDALSSFVIDEKALINILKAFHLYKLASWVEGKKKDSL